MFFIYGQLIYSLGFLVEWFISLSEDLWGSRRGKSMILISDGNSEHVAHSWSKIGFLSAINRSNNRDCLSTILHAKINIK